MSGASRLPAKGGRVDVHTIFSVPFGTGEVPPMPVPVQGPPIDPK
jgi:hypothetical protein